MGDDQACCAHLKVEHGTTDHAGGGTSEWWKCRDCGCGFVQIPLAEYRLAEVRAVLKARCEEMYSEKDRRVAAQEAITNHWIPALQKAQAGAESAYWIARGFIDANVPDWVRGDDGPVYPMLKVAQLCKEALAATLTKTLTEIDVENSTGTRTE